MIITIDGPAGAGKSTVARRVARACGLPYLNSGYIYRAVALRVLEEGGRFERRDLVEEVIGNLDLRFVDDPAGQGPGSPGSTRVFIGDREITDRITSPEVTSNVYLVAGDGGYRKLLVDLQRRFSVPDGVVAEGRDMGSVIFPEAECKIYLDASSEERARRRLGDLSAAGHPATFDEVLSSIRERDERDRGREHAPLCVPQGAEIIPTDSMDIDEVVGEVLARVGDRSD